MANPLDIAASAIGLDERGKRAALTDYLSTGGANLDPATTAWCAAFVNATLQKAGQKGTGSNMARSFMDWGQPVDRPQRGDIAVFSRGDAKGPFGHVGFFEGYNPDGTIRVLGGNQGDAVSVASYSPSRLLGFRRADSGSGPDQGFSMGAPVTQGNALGYPMQAPQSQQNALSLADYGVKPIMNDPRAFMLGQNYG